MYFKEGKEGELCAMRKGVEGFIGIFSDPSSLRLQFENFGTKPHSGLTLSTCTFHAVYIIFGRHCCKRKYSIDSCMSME